MLPAPHTPWVPSKPFQGKSKAGLYGDFVEETDASIGRILASLEKTGQAANTLVIVTSDNGAPWEERDAREAAGHWANARWRGQKADIQEAGHRVPFLLSWPARVESGSTNNSTISLNDLFATCVDLLGAETPANSGEDSVSFLPALDNKPIPSTRRGFVHHSSLGFFSYRLGDWKLLLARDGGAKSEKELAKNPSLPQAQLYNLADDPAETANLYETNPPKADELLAALKNDIQRGRSTDGPESSNDTDRIAIWKSGTRQPTPKPQKAP